VSLGVRARGTNRTADGISHVRAGRATGVVVSREIPISRHSVARVRTKIVKTISFVYNETKNKKNAKKRRHS